MSVVLLSSFIRYLTYLHSFGSYLSIKRENISLSPAVIFSVICSSVDWFVIQMNNNIKQKPRFYRDFCFYRLSISSSTPISESLTSTQSQSQLFHYGF